MANTLKFGNENWATKKDSILAYNDENANFKPLPFVTSRASTATRVNKLGLIEKVAAGIPRVDYLGNTKGAYLLEPQTTNSLLQSNQFDTTWIIAASALDLTSGQSGVYGSNDAWLLKKNFTGARYIQQSLSLSSAQYSYSIYLKAESTNWVYLQSSDGSSIVSSYFDLENGVIGTTAGSNLDSAIMDNIGNGWYRCTLTYTQATSYVRIYPADSNGSISPTNDNGIYIQYAQLEQSSYASSLIPTNGSTVTRLAESADNAGNNQVISSSEGVLYFEGSVSDTLTNSWISLYEKSNSNVNQINLRFVNSTNLIQAVSRAGGLGLDVVLEATITDKTVVNKIAVKYKLNDWALWFNGVEVATATSSNAFTPNSLDVLSLNRVGNSQFFYGNVKDLRVYNTALTDAELVTLTKV